MKRATAAQEAAILARGNVLVQAGAGAGKTRTLVQRCVRWLQESDNNSLDQILMVTFTEAAAAEMRRRIRAELNAALDRQPDNQHLLQELALLDTASISTLHSFCLQLVRQHFYELEIDPQLTVLSEEETRLLAGEVLGNVLQRHYGGELPDSEAVQNLIQAQGRGWDNPVRKLVLRLHEYTQTLADSNGWFRDQFAIFAEPEPRRWEKWLRQILPVWSKGWLRELQNFDGTPAVAKAVAALEKITPSAKIADTHTALREVLRVDDRTNKILWPHGSIGKVREQIQDFFDEAGFLESLTDDDGASIARENSSAGCSKPLTEDWHWSKAPMITLLRLTREFSEAFATAKREQGVVDFHDLEQFSLRLLLDSDSGQPTSLAKHWQRKLGLIFVDEYQDINGAQDAILSALGRDGPEANRFLVGDVKQSIYRFRLADPHIFQNYADRWGREPGAGKIISLPENFRSHEAILEFINPFFAALMRKEIGGVAFGPEAWLQFGDREGRPALTWEGELRASAATNPTPRVELHLCLRGRSNEAEAESDEDDANGESQTLLSDLSQADKEARIIGLRLREMRSEQFPVWDAHLNRQRPVEWADIVILLRSRQNKVESFAKEFARLGIPLTALRGGFFESIEVMDLLNVLKLLDNPLQDLEAIAVLRSPLVGLTLDELATVRLASKGRFWTALQRFCRREGAGIGGQESGVRGQGTGVRSQGSAGSDNSANPGKECASAITDERLTPDSGLQKTFRKVERFLESFRRWRRLARETSLSRCLEEILDETHYAEWLLTQSRGQQRRASISKLLAWTRQFDQFRRQGLFRFLRFIEAQREASIDHEPAPVEPGNAVRLMSIHQSKGLEFPIVVVADLGKNFNLTDLRGEIILDEEYGLCAQIKPPFTHQRYPSLPYWLAQQRQRKEALGEEMRVLYVALTRACHTLMLVGSTTRKRAEEQWPAATRLTARNVLRARSYLDWIGPWLPNATGCSDWLAIAAGSSKLVRWQIYDEEDSQIQTTSESGDLTQQNLQEIPDQAQLEALRERLSWKYPFVAATTEPAKASVSGLRRRIQDEADTELPQVLFGRSDGSRGARRSGLSSTEIGTAHHLFLQFVCLDMVGSVVELKSEAGRLERTGILTREECQALNLQGIVAFWQSGVGSKLLGNRGAVHRELPFTARISAADLARLVPPQAEALVPSNEKRLNPDAPRQPTASKLTALAALPDEFLVVQGVVDLAVVLPAELWILDFKTDEVTEADWEEKSRTYAAQLKLYSLALGRIYRRPVTNCWLHFLALNRTVECDSDLRAFA